MKGVTDIFISKQTLAIVWFMVACACLAGTGWYVYDVAVTSRGNMLFVPVENSYVNLDRSQKPQELDQLVDYHTRLALETYLNRGPNGVLNPQRMGFLFTGQATQQVRVDLRDSAYDFDQREVHQMVEVGKVRVQLFIDGNAFTLAEGQVVRVSQDPLTKESIIQSFQFTAEMKWGRNNSLRDGRRFPFVCTEVSYKLIPLSSTE